MYHVLFYRYVRYYAVLYNTASVYAAYNRCHL